MKEQDDPSTERFRILHAYADVGVEDEVLHTFGQVVRIGWTPSPNPFSTVVRADARHPPVRKEFDLGVWHHPCGRWSRATPSRGDPETHPDDLARVRELARDYCEHYILENVPDAPLHDPVELCGGQFGLPIYYARAFETSFPVPEPRGSGRGWTPGHGPLSEQGETGRAWVGTNEGWRLAKGYGHDWPARELKRHGIPAPFIRYLLYWWIAAREGETIPEQATLSEVGSA